VLLTKNFCLGSVKPHGTLRVKNTKNANNKFTTDARICTGSAKNEFSSRCAMRGSLRRPSRSHCRGTPSRDTTRGSPSRSHYRGLPSRGETLGSQSRSSCRGLPSRVQLEDHHPDHLVRDYHLKEKLEV